MRKYFLFAALCVLALTVGITGHRTGVVQAKSWGFTNSDLNGTYAYQYSGSINFPDPALAAFNGPYAAIGQATGDGQGNFTSKYIECYNGVIAPGTSSGSYTVKPDGTVTAIAVGLHEMTGVLFDDGKQARFTVAKLLNVSLPEGFTGVTMVGNWMKQGKPYGWSNADWSGSFATRASGTMALPAAHPLAILNGPLAGIGRMGVDGNGGLIANVFTTINGVMARESNTGTYTIKPDGWLKVTLYGASLTLVFDAIMADDGNLLFSLLTEIPGIGLPAGYTGVTWTATSARQ